MTLGKLTSARAKALKGTSDYELMVDGKKVVHVNPDHASKTVHLLLEGSEAESKPVATGEPAQQATTGTQGSDMLDQEGNYVLF